MKRELDEREALSLLKMYDRRPLDLEHRDLRCNFFDAIKAVLGLHSLGRVRVYLTGRTWHLVKSGPGMGLWVEHEEKRVQIGDYRIGMRQNAGHVTIISEYGYPDVVYVLTSNSEYDWLMEREIGVAPAEFTPRVSL